MIKGGCFGGYFFEKRCLFRMVDRFNVWFMGGVL